MKKYQPLKIEKKWQNQWAKNNFKLWQAKDFKAKSIYILDMFPYPSGEGLHVGHIEGYTGTDILARYYRMKGYNVLHPMGWDAFGLPAENYALKMKKNPMDFVPKNIKRFKKQLLSLGFSYDWRREINTTDPEYYKWTQWIFLQFYKHGLAYEKEAPVNFCPNCQTGLANEEVIEGRCERCQTPTTIKKIRQWHLKITQYAERLLEDLEELDWPENIKEMQRHWIGKSEGVEINFPVEGKDLKISIFTSRVDTLFGVSFLVLAPEHSLALKVANGDYYFVVERYVNSSINKPERERLIAKTKSGVFTGSYAIHPLTNQKIPIWISDYVLPHYGTGAIMGVPAHDERDFEFAQKFNLPTPIVITTDQEKKFTIPYEGEGILINSEEFTGLPSQEARELIAEKIERLGLGQKKIYYRLRDWVFSRQRYWGEPIPIVKCPKCGNVPVPEKELPVKLPRVKSYSPTGTGESPLINITRWVKTKCPICKGPAQRETNTMPQWAGSCWYYLRFIDPKNKKAFADFKKLKNWLPVDIYVGGAEHAVLHLLYARFWHKFLYDLGLVPTKEPFQKLINQGIILAPDHEKMSKSRGNVINPDEIVQQYGADTLRMFEMFMGPFEATKSWDPQGIQGIWRFLNRVWEIGQKIIKQKNKKKERNDKLKKMLHRTIKKVTDDIENLRFNTAISSLMELQREFAWQISKKISFPQKYFEDFLKLLSPFAPHICEELWSMLGYKRSIQLQKWPKYDPRLIEEKKINIVIQINGKKKALMSVYKDTSEEELIQMAQEIEKIKNLLAGKKIDKTIVLKNKLVNFVVK